MQDFHNLRVWNEANDLTLAINRLVQRFPRSNHGTLRNQMVRAAESIADNIAEGCGAATSAEFARFLDMSIKSASELENQIERSHGYGLTRDRERDTLAAHVCNVRKMAWGLRKKVLAAPQRPPDGPRTTAHGKRPTENGPRKTAHGKR
ncbi:MAG: four helix bundle protein, partial [bacterium]